VGVRWCQRIVLRWEPPGWPATIGRRECLFGLTAFGIGLVLIEVNMITGPGALAGHSLMAWLSINCGLPAAWYSPTIRFLWHVLADSLWCLLLPAIAVGAANPLRQGMSLVRNNFARLFAIFLIGKLPWLGLSVIGLTPLLLATAGPQSHAAHLAWIMVDGILHFCRTSLTIVLAAAAYRELVQSQDIRRIAAVFE